MKKFSKGTVVKITNCELQYTTYYSWMSKNAPEYYDAWYHRSDVLSRYDNGRNAVVVKHAPHGKGDKELYLIFYVNNFQLIDEDGIELAYKKRKPFYTDEVGCESKEEINE